MTFLELILLMYDSNYKMPYHPPPRETVICTVHEGCEDARGLYVGCIKEFNILICPELIGV